MLNLNSWDLNASWLSDLENDPHKTRNHAEDHPDEVQRLRLALRDTLHEIGAPPEQHDRLRLRHLEA